MAENLPDRAVSSLVAGIRIKNVPIGWVQGFRLQESFTQFPIDALGDAYTKYHELTRVRVSGSFDRIRIYNSPLTDLREAGGPDNDRWLKQGETIEFVRQYLTSFVVYNIHTGEDLYLVEQFKPTDRSITLTTDGVLMENCSFVARRMVESKPTLTVDGQTPTA
jgi:hypothetical protein